MSPVLFLGTAGGLAACAWDGESWRMQSWVLEGRSITSLSLAGKSLLAGTPAGIWRSSDGGQSWEEANRGLDIRHVRAVKHHPQMPEMAFAGTEPAAIFISFDGGLNWQIRPEVSELRDRLRWYLPYSPEAGCIRDFAFASPRAYAAVEVGGVLVSSDDGETWRILQSGWPETGRLPRWAFVDRDVHALKVHPVAPEMLFAATGNGLFRSYDSGKNWRKLHPGYCRALWIDPQNADAMILGPAENVDRNGRIEATQDGGKTWQAASGGLVVPWKRHQVERFVTAGQHLFAVLSNGDLVLADLNQSPLTWKAVLPEVKKVQSAIYGDWG